MLPRFMAWLSYSDCPHGSPQYAPGPLYKGAGT